VWVGGDEQEMTGRERGARGEGTGAQGGGERVPDMGRNERIFQGLSTMFAWVSRK
jgi:hypothetical protein